MTLPTLRDVERDCLERYVRLVRDRLGGTLLRVCVYGSVARGESWPAGMPIRSDLDLLVIVREPLDRALEQELVDATYSLFLESGRQISPTFRTPEQHSASASRDAIEADAVELAP